jgi:TolA-binding protein
MGHPMTPLERLGKEVARDQDRALGPVVDRARERFEQGSARRERGPRPRGRSWALVAAAAICLVAVGFYVRRARPLTFELEASRPGVVKEWVVATLERDVPMRFSDGTTVLLARGSQGRVAELTPRGASVRLERGRAAVSVPPGKGAEWRFDTGPFAVFVTGTRFDVSWDQKRQLFELSMQDGSVKVEGPTIVGERIVVAGQTLRIPLAPEEADEVAREASALAPLDAAAPVRTTKPRASLKAPEPVRAGVRAAAKTWRDLAAEGKFHEALAAALADYDAICAHGSAADVVALGDAARYAGDQARAQKAYAAVRERFAGSAASANAAFELGRMAFQGGDDASAVSWFELYVRENGHGPLAREALGRLIEAHARRHDDASARRIAEQYLRAYPGGPHAKLARSLVDR